jgi:hypothetical protein
MGKLFRGFLQLLIGSLYDINCNLDRFKPISERDLFGGALSISCFGLFANIATILVLIWAGLTEFYSTEIRFPSTNEGKVVWALIMVVAFAWLAMSRHKILAADRYRFSSQRRRTTFLVSYYVLTSAALIWAVQVYSSTYRSIS